MPAALTCFPAALDFDAVSSTAMFNTLGGVRALPANELSKAIVCRSLADARGYERAELFALAEVGYHYFRAGGLRLAQVIFEGLTAIDPKEPYFWLARGLVADYLGAKAEAEDAYRRVISLDPSDPRPHINLAELQLEKGDRRAARAHLNRALSTAQAGDLSPCEGPRGGIPGRQSANRRSEGASSRELALRGGLEKRGSERGASCPSEARSAMVLERGRSGTDRSERGASCPSEARSAMVLEKKARALLSFCAD